MCKILSMANTMIKISDYTVTNLKLNKLLYYAYGINLVLNDDEKVDESPEAWDYGPVFPSVYQAFKKYVNQPIEGVHKIPFHADILKNDSKIYEIISATYRKYGSLGEFDLVDRTHADGTPWADTYVPGIKNLTINDGIIKDYFIEHVVVSG